MTAKKAITLLSQLSVGIEGVLDMHYAEAIDMAIEALKGKCSENPNGSNLISRQDAIRALEEISFTHWFELGEYIGECSRELQIINADKAVEKIEQLPPSQPDDLLTKNKDEILRAGLEGREWDFYIGGRLFAIREKAQ